MSTSLVCLDADVLLSAFRHGANARRAKRIITAQNLLTYSDWTMTEVASALSREVRAGRATAEKARKIIKEIDEWAVEVGLKPVSGADFHDARGLLERFDLKLRAGDALHLAISRRLGAHLATFDKDLASAAEAVGQPLVRG